MRRTATLDHDTPETETRDPSLVQLIKDLRDDTLALLRQELALAKREMTSKIARIGRNAAFLMIGAVIGLYCLFFILLGLSDLLQAGLFASGFSGTVSTWLAPLILGMLLGIAALLLALKALRSLRREKPLPEKTVATLREDRDWLKGKVK
jgi:hypothetical protein